MIVPSIDLQGGQAVQLVGGERLAIEAGDPHPIAERFALAGEVAVIDLDAAIGAGSNTDVVHSLIRRYPCRVGGGIRSFEAAVQWLDAGARKIILGTAAEPELLRKLPRERVIAALDARDGEVVVEGWRTATGRTVLDRMAELREYVSGFLVTFVELEGRMAGTAMERVSAIVDAAGDARVTVAGGVTTANEIRELDRLGADAQVGMALYTGDLKLADAIAAPLVSDRTDGLWPTVVVDEAGIALGLCYSNMESLRVAVRDRVGAYWSRKRGLWIKGESSGNCQELLRIDIDCDRDALRFTVRQTGVFCHLGMRSCWGEDTGLHRLSRRLANRLIDAPDGSYTRRLFEEEGLLDAKVVEEARELVEAKSPERVIEESADLIYFVLAKAIRDGGSLAAIEAELNRRELKLTRRKGDAK